MEPRVAQLLTSLAINDYIQADQKCRLSWPSNKTKLYSYDGLTVGLLYQIFQNLACSYRLTGISKMEMYRCQHDR